MNDTDQTPPYRVIVLCYSSDTPNRLAFGPFSGSTLLEARDAAKSWLATEPCRPSQADPFWSDARETHDRNAYQLLEGQTAHEIVEMVD